MEAHTLKLKNAMNSVHTAPLYFTTKLFVETRPNREVKPSVPAKPMKISEAMRLGAALRPQCHKAWFKRVRDAKGRYAGYGSCAMAAAYEAATGFGPKQFRKRQHMGDGFAQWWNSHFEFGSSEPHRIHRQVLHMNDVQRCSREQIADWVESQGY